MRGQFRSGLLALAIFPQLTTGSSLPARMPPQAARPQALARTALTLPSGKKISVEVAKTEQERSTGLMWRRELRRDTGMLFVFEDEAQQSFWMKNTLVDLDMVFIDSQKRITTIAAHVPKSAPDTPDSEIPVRQGSARYVLELPAGMAGRYKLAAGQVLKFDENRLQATPAKPARARSGKS